jgi:hypothetical protein
MGERTGSCRILVEISERMIPLRRPRRRWKDNIKMNLQAV